MKRLLYNIALLITLIFVLPGCTGLSGTWVNEHIEQDKRAQIKKLNDRLIDAIAHKNISGVKALMSDTLLKLSQTKVDTLISTISVAFEGSKYEVLDEYYTKNIIDKSVTSLSPGNGRANDYVVAYQVFNKEMYVSLLLSKENKNKLLILVGYGKYGKEWKINFLQFGPYSIFGKTAPEYYHMAQEAYRKSNLINAVEYMIVAKNSLKPGNDYFQYKNEKEILAFYDAVLKEANATYKLPMELDNVASKPKIVNINPEITKEGCFPMIYYITDVSFKDTVALKVENEAVKKEVKRIFQGIDQDKAYILYKALNTMPDGRKQVEHYGFVEKL